MTKFKSFNKQNLSSLRSELQEVLNRYAGTANIEIEVGKMVYGDEYVKIEVKALVEGGDTRELKMAKELTVAYGMQMTNANGDEIVGYYQSRYKYPWTVRHASDKKLYKYTHDQASRKFKNEQ